MYLFLSYPKGTDDEVDEIEAYFETIPGYNLFTSFCNIHIDYVKFLLERTDTILNLVEEEIEAHQLPYRKHNKLAEIRDILRAGKSTCTKHLTLECKCGEDGDIDSVRSFVGGFDIAYQEYELIQEGYASIGIRFKILRTQICDSALAHASQFRDHHIWILMNFYLEYNPFFVMQTVDSGKREFVPATEPRAMKLMNF
jgi:hypothetical protein